MKKLIIFLWKMRIINKRQLAWCLHKDYIDFFTYYSLLFNKDLL